MTQGVSEAQVEAALEAHYFGQRTDDDQRDNMRRALKAAIAVSPPPDGEVAVKVKGLEWEPIETAPKDGSSFLGYMEGAAEPYDIWHWDATVFTEAGYGFWINQAESNIDEMPTHWQPLTALDGKGETR